MGNKETKLREIFQDIDTSEHSASEDNLLTVEVLKNYLNGNDPKVEEVFNNVTIGKHHFLICFIVFKEAQGEIFFQKNKSQDRSSKFLSQYRLKDKISPLHTFFN